MAVLHRSSLSIVTLTPEWAGRMAEELLQDVETRWAHVRGVAQQAVEISKVVPARDRALLVAAAYLHDIGYSPAVCRVGVHQLDGAAYLRERGHERLARLVAHHSEARFEIEVRGYSHLLEQYEPEDQHLQDALTYCDLTTAATGERISVEARLAEVEGRYGQAQDSSATQVLEALARSRPYLKRAVSRTERRLQMAS